MTLTPEQRETLWENTGSPRRGHIVVSARPGTGKTSTVTEYCVDLADAWPSHYAPWQGIAMLSYTNVAKDELEEKVRQLGRGHRLLSAPNFVGTIDSFVNHYLFLPFGARLMGFDGRPRLVGEPHGPWKSTIQQIRDRSTDSFSPVYFDCYSLDESGEPIRIDSNPRKLNAQHSKAAPVPTSGNRKKILKMKEYIWRSGVALQSDANCLAYSALQKSGYLTRSLAQRFPIIVVDEAQDMTAVQHAIIDQLALFGQNHIVLIGDEYQAIYEWNTARPQLLTSKRTGGLWLPKTMSKTFRCGPAVCATLSAMTDDETVLAPAAAGKNAHYDEPIQVRSFENKLDENDLCCSIDEMANYLVTRRAHSGGTDDSKKIAILSRSRSDASLLQSYVTKSQPATKERIEWGEPLTKNYLRVVYHSLNRDIYEAVRSYENLMARTRGYDFISDMRTALCKEWDVDRPGYREVLFDDLAKVGRPFDSSEDLTIGQCTSSCDADLFGLPRSFLAQTKRDCNSFRLGEKRGQDRGLSQIFGERAERITFHHPSIDGVDLVFSTVHGVKGETYDGVIFYTKESTTSCNCTPSQRLWAQTLRHPISACENKRIAYVAISRSAQILHILTPESSKSIWEDLAQARTPGPDGAAQAH